MSHLTEAQWNTLVDRQRKLLAGEQIDNSEEVKNAAAAEEQKKKTLFDVANVQWDYFSPQNSHKVSKQKQVTHADKLKVMRDKIMKTHASFDDIREKTEQVLAKTTLSTEQDVL